MTADSFLQEMLLSRFDIAQSNKRWVLLLRHSLDVCSTTPNGQNDDTPFWYLQHQRQNGAIDMLEQGEVIQRADDDLPPRRLS